MIKTILFTICLLLSGCATAKFDYHEYSKIVSASTTLSPKICFDSKTLQTGLNSFADQLDYLQVYEGGIPDNKNTITMLDGVQNEIVRFQNMLSKNPNVSFTYCNDKITGIRHTLSIVLQAEGSKSK